MNTSFQISCDSMVSQFSQLNLDPSLRVRIPARSRRRFLHHVLAKWTNVALQRRDSELMPIFQISVDVVSSIQNILRHTITKRVPNSRAIYECFDRSHECQAIGVVKFPERKKVSKKPFKGFVEILFLASHPANIRGDGAKQLPNRVHGAAMCVIKKIAFDCVQKKLQGIYLWTMGVSAGFYLKSGFEFYFQDDLDHFHSFDPQENLKEYVMCLTGEKLKILGKT